MPHLCVTVGVKIWSVPLLTDFKEGEVINSTGRTDLDASFPVFPIQVQFLKSIFFFKIRDYYAMGVKVD